MSNRRRLNAPTRIMIGVTIAILLLTGSAIYFLLPRPTSSIVDYGERTAINASYTTCLDAARDEAAPAYPVSFPPPGIISIYDAQESVSYYITTRSNENGLVVMRGLVLLRATFPDDAQRLVWAATYASNFTSSSPHADLTILYLDAGSGHPIMKVTGAILENPSMACNSDRLMLSDIGMAIGGVVYWFAFGCVLFTMLSVLLIFAIRTPRTS